MKRIAWLTDIHLNFVPEEEIDRFVDRVRDEGPDLLLIGGDIGEAKDVTRYLALLDDRLQLPIYFVLGNHDYYFGSIERVREEVRVLCAQRPRLTYLTDGGVWPLTSSIGLIGHDGWADGRVGDYERSNIMLNDYKLIDELAGVDKATRRPLLESLGDAAAAAVRVTLPAALQRYREVFFLTHVPPLRAACWHEGSISDDHWAPHFTCHAMGETLIEIMQDHGDHRLTVLCGHTHGHGECQPLPNVCVLTGGAEYGAPCVNRLFELPEAEPLPSQVGAPGAVPNP